MLRNRQRKAHDVGWVAALALLLFPALTPQRARPVMTQQQATAARPEVSGRLLTYDGRPLLSAAVLISRQGDPDNGRHVGQARIRPDGTFVFTDVPAGHYTVRARGDTRPGGPTLFASFSLVVGDRDVTRIELTLTPGALLEGRIRFEGHHGHARPTGALRVRAPLTDGSRFGETLGGRVEPNGSFRLTSVMPGSHVLVIDGLSFPWRIAKAQFEGTDLAEKPFEVDQNQRVRDLEVVVTDTAGGINGSIALPPGASTSGVIAIAFPADPARRRLPLRFVKTGRPNADGAYQLIDLAPGEYLLAAILDLADHEAHDEALLERLAPTAARVTVREAQFASAALQAVRAPARTVP